MLNRLREFSARWKFKSFEFLPRLQILTLSWFFSAFSETFAFDMGYNMVVVRSLLFFYVELKNRTFVFDHWPGLQLPFVIHTFWKKIFFPWGWCVQELFWSFPLLFKEVNFMLIFRWNVVSKNGNLLTCSSFLARIEKTRTSLILICFELTIFIFPKQKSCTFFNFSLSFLSSVFSLRDSVEFVFVQ